MFCRTHIFYYILLHYFFLLALDGAFIFLGICLVTEDVIIFQFRILPFRRLPVVTLDKGRQQDNIFWIFHACVTKNVFMTVSSKAFVIKNTYRNTRYQKPIFRVVKKRIILKKYFHNSAKKLDLTCINI